MTAFLGGGPIRRHPLLTTTPTTTQMEKPKSMIEAQYPKRSGCRSASGKAGSPTVGSAAENGVQVNIVVVSKPKLES
jgi:hypothetical protein